MDVLVNDERQKLIIRKSVLNRRKPNLDEAWSKIYDEYYKARKLKVNNLKQAAKVSAMILLHDGLAAAINILPTLKGELRDRVDELLKSKGYGIDYSNDFKEEHQRVKNDIAALKNAIQIESAKVEKGKKMEKDDILREVFSLEKLVGRELDPYSITERKWIQMWEYENKVLELKNS
jgi:predicted  nucleic acid-binding Zn-ribbon protein